jgi:mono/diheme cytochrome c family protein
MQLSRFLLPLLVLGASSAFANESTHIAQTYLDKCARCHGDTGSGETPLGKKLHCKDYSSKQAQSLFTDEDALRSISDGKTAGEKRTMPAYKDDLPESERQALLGYLRSLAKRA